MIKCHHILIQPEQMDRPGVEHEVEMVLYFDVHKKRYAKRVYVTEPTFCAMMKEVIDINKQELREQLVKEI